MQVDGIPRIDEVRVDQWSVSFTLLLMILTTLIFGLAPAVTATSARLDRTLRDNSRSSLSVSGRRVNDVFVILQFALSLVLLIGAGLLLRSFQELLAVQPGFRPENVLALEVSLPRPRYTNASQAELLYTQLRERVLALPGVRAAGLVNHRPLTGKRWETHYTVEGQDPIPETLEGLTTLRIATPGYFDAMGMALLRGRSINESDRADSPLVVVVDAALARRHWPGDAAIGKRLRLGRASDNNPWMTIVGVVPNVRDESLAETPSAHIYRQGMKLASAGIAAGLAAAAALSHVLRTLLFGVSPIDLITFVTIPLLLAGVALMACWLPARRASRVDPIEVLREN